MTNKTLLQDNLLWPDSLADKIYDGFSSKQLKNICGKELLIYDEQLPYGSSAWLNWPVEIYSFGRCYRQWLNLPSWFPLSLYGDHGIAQSGMLAPHEIDHKGKVFLTWQKDRAKNLKKKYKKKILRIPHPWIIFNRINNIKKRNNAYGTLVFLPHSNVGTKILDYDFEKYFSKLNSLPKKYHPLVLCMHQHDVKKNFYLKIKKYKLPIISIGNTSSVYFVERFYNIISRFNYATSSSGGSELFLCEEFNLKYFIRGDAPNYFNFGLDQIPKGILKPIDKIGIKLLNKKKKLFSEFPPKASKAKKVFVQDMLGLDVDFDKAKKKLLIFTIQETLLNFHLIILYIFLGLIKKIKYKLLKVLYDK
jgi:hypothetical protein